MTGMDELIKGALAQLGGVGVLAFIVIQIINWLKSLTDGQAKETDKNQDIIGTALTLLGEVNTGIKNLLEDHKVILQRVDQNIVAMPPAISGNIQTFFQTFFDQSVLPLLRNVERKQDSHAARVAEDKNLCSDILYLVKALSDTVHKLPTLEDYNKMIKERDQLRDELAAARNDAEMQRKLKETHELTIVRLNKQITETKADIKAEPKKPRIPEPGERSSLPALPNEGIEIAHG